MASHKPPSAADQQLIEHAARHGFTITVKQLAVWRRAGLLPGNKPGGGLGRGRGSTSTPPPESFDLVIALARLAGRGKRPTDLALLLFAEGLPVPEATVRSAFRTAVDTMTLPGEDEPADDDLEERLNQLSNTLSDSGQILTLVPARARRIDERIASILGELPAELMELDKNTKPTPFTPQDATLTAVSATLGGSVPLQDLGSLLRAMSPAMPAHPFASLVETTREDVPETADTVLAEDGSLAFLPDGDARDLLRTLADTASLEDLAAGWHTAQQVREWALDLCERVERELDAGHLGEAVTEWLHGRQLLSGLSVMETLRDRRWSPTKGGLSALMLLFQCQMFVMLDSLVPGCQWHVLQIPAVVPPPLRDLILDKVVGLEAAAASQLTQHESDPGSR